MGLAAYEIIGSDAEWRVRREGKAEETKGLRRLSKRRLWRPPSLCEGTGSRDRTGARTCQRTSQNRLQASYDAGGHGDGRCPSERVEPFPDIQVVHDFRVSDQQHQDYHDGISQHAVDHGALVESFDRIHGREVERYAESTEMARTL